MDWSREHGLKISANLSRERLIQDGKHFAYLMLAASAIGQGARMLYQGILAPGSSYVPSGIDLAFDWVTADPRHVCAGHQLIKVRKGALA